MDWRYRLLRIDSQAGITVGMAALLLSNWLDEWYQLPLNFIYFLALVNIAYGCCSFSLLVRRKRPKNLIMLLVVANLTWALLCLRWVFVFSQTASPFGLAHLLLEALFVGGLACLEWRWRELLQTNPTHNEQLAKEAQKLLPKEEHALAEEGLAQSMDTWDEY